MPLGSVFSGLNDVFSQEKLRLLMLKGWGKLPKKEMEESEKRISELQVEIEMLRRQVDDKDFHHC